MGYSAKSLNLLLFLALVLPLCLGGHSALAAAKSTAGRNTVMMSVDAAFKYNPELKASQESRQMSAHAVDRAKAGHLPTVTAFAGVGLGSKSDPTLREFREDDKIRSAYDAGVRLVQPIWHGGGIQAGVETSLARLESANLLLEDRGAAIAFDAIVAHTEVVRRTELVQLAKDNVREHAQILATVKERYDTGVATIGELNQIQSRHARAKATLAAYESALDSVIANYLRVTGKHPSGLIKTPAPKKTFASAEAVRETTLEFNPALKSSFAEVRAAQGERGQAESRYHPFIDFQTGPSWSERDSEAGIRTSEYVGELRMNWEFFSGGADRANVAMSNAKIRQARQNMHALMNVLNEDIESTWSSYRSSLVQAQDYAAAKKASRLAREDYYRQFLSAKRSLIDVLDAENDFFYAASQEVLCLGDRVIAAYRMLALSGTLLSSLHIDPLTLRTDKPTIMEDMPSSIRFGFNSPLEDGQKNTAVKR
ncbi:TolC family protein [Desulfovibrio sp. OttesenSCG-928-M14]|nr:TolC family protein [Desulfovibrio sp. OttesenSCG-928-M14]